jgi:hypothetical protein
MSMSCDGYKASGVSDPLVGYVPPLAGPDYYGVGSPEGVVAASPAATYIDTATGDFYAKQTGTGPNGWILVTGGGGGTPMVFFGTGDPNGVVTATRPAVFYTALGAYWIKTGVGTNNTGWEQIIFGG